MTEFRLGDYLAHIDQAASEAMGFVQSLSREEFDSDRRTQLAVTMALVVVGEASARIAEKYPQFITQNSHIAWREIRGMRNHVVHGYFDIDLDIIWDTLWNELPKLIQQIAAARKDISIFE